MGKEEEMLKIDESYSASSEKWSDKGSKKRDGGRDSGRDSGRDGRRDKNKSKEFGRYKDGDRGGSSRGSSRDRNTGGEDMTRLFINIGKSANIQVNDVVGAIAGETGIPGKSIGEIALFDKFTFVEVPTKYSDKVIKIMNKNQIKGNKIAIQVANDR